jgi:hypothetical protein
MFRGPSGMLESVLKVFRPACCSSGFLQAVRKARAALHAYRLSMLRSQ